MKMKWTLFDTLLVMLVLLAGLSVYFSFVRPIEFTKKIIREGVTGYGEIEVVLPPDTAWLADEIAVGEEHKDVYGTLEWKITAKGEKKTGAEIFKTITAKLLVVVEDSGLLRYGKYTLVKGSRIILISDHYFIEGRIGDFHLSDEKVPF